METLDHWTYTRMTATLKPAENKLDELSRQIAVEFRAAEPSTAGKISPNSTFDIAEYILYIMHINPGWWISRPG